MLPTLVPGQMVLVDRRSDNARVGDVVVAEHPNERGRLVVKRVTRVEPQGILLSGDNAPESSDVGPLPAEAVLGRVVCTLP